MHRVNTEGNPLVRRQDRREKNGFFWRPFWEIFGLSEEERERSDYVNPKCEESPMQSIDR